MTAVLESDLAVENPLVEGLERLPVHPTTLVVFGATGDLARRKLLPAIYNLAHDGALSERFELVGVARTEQPHEDFRQLAREHCNAGSDAALLVVGAYPNGMRWDIRRGDPGEREEVLANIARVPLTDQDPVRGERGPLVELWSRTA